MESPELSARRTLTSRDYSLAVVLFILTVLLGAGQMVKGVSGVYHDDGIYVTTAKSLAEGRGYHLINFPGAPPQTKYPPLYPALLALVWKLHPSFPDNLVVMQWLTLLSGGAMVGLAYLYLVRFGYFSRGVAAAAGALILTSTQFLYFATLTLSEIPFGLVGLMTLWVLEKQEERASFGPRGQFFLGMLLTIPFLTRTIGVVFIPLGFYLLWRKGRSLRWAGLGAAGLLAPWLFWMLVISRWQGVDGVEMYYTNYLTWWLTHIKPALSQILSLNLLFVAAQTVALGVNLEHAALILNPWVRVFLVFLGLITWFFVVRQLLQGRILPSFLAAYILIVVVWPWPPTRFLIPIAPLIMAYLINWLQQLLSKAPRWLYARGLGLLILGVVLFGNLTLVGWARQLSQTMHYPLISPRQDVVAWASYEDIFQKLQEYAQPGEVIASGLDTMIFLYTGRQAFRPFQGRPTALFYGQEGPALGSSEEVVNFLKHYKARYLVQTPMSGFSEEKPLRGIIEELTVKHPGLMRLVYVGPDNRFKIYLIAQDEKLDCRPPS